MSLNEKNFKDYDEVKNVNNYGRLYYDFIDLNRYDSGYFLSYLIDTEPNPESWCLNQGYEDYGRYSDTFIKEKLGQGLTNHIINQILDDLVEHDYIYVHHQCDKHGKPKQKGVRYIKLNHSKILYAFGLANDYICVNNCIQLPTFDEYKDIVYKLSNSNYNKYHDIINPENIERSDVFHLDHIYSIRDTFDNYIDPEIVASPVNLRVITQQENLFKGKKSDMTKDELLEKYNEFNAKNCIA